MIDFTLFVPNNYSNDINLAKTTKDRQHQVNGSTLCHRLLQILEVKVHACGYLARACVSAYTLHFPSSFLHYSKLDVCIYVLSYLLREYRKL